MKTARGVKIHTLANGQQLFFWYANNAGRGTDNVTVALCPAGVVRATVSKLQMGAIAVTRTSGWGGT